MSAASLLGGPRPPRICVSFFADLFAPRPLQRELAWAAFVHRLTTFPVREDVVDKRRLPCWSPATFRPDAPAIAASVGEIGLLVLDVDGGIGVDEALERCAPFAAVAHTTWRHADHAPRLRLVLPLAAPVPRERWMRTWRRAVDDLDLPVDRSCSNANRRYLLPARPSEGAPHAFAVRDEGIALDLLTLVPLRPAPRRHLGSGWVPVRSPDQRRAVAEDLGAAMRGEGDGARAEGIGCPGVRPAVGVVLPDAGPGDVGEVQASQLVRLGRGGPHPAREGRMTSEVDATPMVEGELLDDTTPDPDVVARIGEAGPKGRRATRLTVRTILETDPRWVGRLRHDRFRDQVALDGRPLADPDLTRLSCWIEEVYDATPSRDLVHEVALCVAEAQAFHPVRDWLGGLAWDGVERAPGLLVDVLGVEDTPLHREMGRAFLVGAVARVMSPGCKLDTMLVLVGAQGAGKSRFCAGLMPDATWFGDTPVDLRSKDAYVALQGKWLYELAEMEAVRGRSATRVKSFLSSPVDHYRAPYGRAAGDHPRQCVFVGTSNHPDLFDDGTGSRRFWPVQIGRVDLARLQRDRDALWAEAVVRYERGESWHLDAALDRERQATASRYQATDPHRERLEAWLSTVSDPFTTSDALAKGLGISADRVDRSLQTRIGPLLHELGCVKFRSRQQGPRAWMWQPPVGAE